MTTPSHPSPLAQLLHTAREHAKNHSLSIEEQRQIIDTLSLLLEDSARETERPLPGLDMQDVRGQEHVKRAIEVAAAGGHNLLLVGPPGAGKRLLARTLMSVLPETTDPRPFQAPHASCDLAAFVGRSDPLMLGELTLAHDGLLFLEDLAAFPPPHLLALHHAVERNIIAPQGTSHAFFPARFVLVATIEPCPCGWFDDPVRECCCTAEEILQHHRRVSVVVPSCFALQIEVPYVKPEALLDKRAGEGSRSIRQRVEAARERQRRRFAGTHFSLNRDLATIDAIQQYCALRDPAAEKLLRAAVQQLHLSAQQALCIQCVSRSIADLAESDAITTSHIAEAIQYRGRLGR